MSDVDCTICTEEFENPVTLECTHKYCFKCIYSWRENSCPLCRKKICDKVIVKENDVSMVQLVDRMRSLRDEEVESMRRMAEQYKKQTSTCYFTVVLFTVVIISFFYWTHAFIIYDHKIQLMEKIKNNQTDMISWITEPIDLFIRIGKSEIPKVGHCCIGNDKWGLFCNRKNSTILQELGRTFSCVMETVLVAQSGNVKRCDQDNMKEGEVTLFGLFLGTMSFTVVVLLFAFVEQQNLF